MARFRGGASGLSPLAIQLRATTATLRVTGWSAGVDTNPGVATLVSRVVVTRPSSIGTPAGTGPAQIVGVTNPAAVPTAELLTAFGTPPSFPSVSSYPTLAGFYTDWSAGLGEGLLVLPGTALLLYATSDIAAGAAWSATIEWDEA
jgi:hypothetical protein